MIARFKCGQDKHHRILNQLNQHVDGSQKVSLLHDTCRSFLSFTNLRKKTLSFLAVEKLFYWQMAGHYNNYILIPEFILVSDRDRK